MLQFATSRLRDQEYHSRRDAQEIKPVSKVSSLPQAALRISAQSSSAVEGIRAPFAKGASKRRQLARPPSSDTGSGASPRPGDSPLEHLRHLLVVTAHRGVDACDVCAPASTDERARSPMAAVPLEMP